MSLRDKFRRPSHSDTSAALSEAEQALKSWRVKYQKKPDGSLFVPKNLDISYKGLTALPDLSCVIVGGDFRCNANELESLKGAPAVVGRDFDCSNNRLVSLKHGPVSVGRNFHCHGNLLTSLFHAPAAVGQDFVCYSNKLSSLEHASKPGWRLISDFGVFESVDAAPLALRTDPAPKQPPVKRPPGFSL